MRIINGKYGGRIFNVNISSQTRPTSNFAKEGLFNILKNKIDFSEISVLDLFAGIGTIGLEFASLDVMEVKMIDESKQAVETLKQICKKLETKNVKIEKSEVLKFLEKNISQYHIVFADPPYDYKYYDLLIATVLEKNLLISNGYFILEHYKKLSFSKIPFFVDVRNYGDASFSFFKK